MPQSKRCLLIHADDKRELVYKNTKSHGFETSELEKHIDQLNKVDQEIGDRISISGASLRPYVLVYYGSSYIDKAINMADLGRIHNLCRCRITPIHDFHGTVGVAKYVDGQQVDYEEGDLEIAVASRRGTCKLS